MTGAKSNDNTAAVIDYLIGFQKDSGHWRVTTVRPPSEASHFAATFVALRGIRAYASTEQKKLVEPRIAEVRNWLTTATVKDTEDRVFRLRALAEVDADGGAIQSAADELAATQRDDGGWAQTADMKSDAYATGSALAALHEAGAMCTDDVVYRRGLRYLLKTQLPDGSWHVVTRSKPIQKYFETGFPHDEDQFISSAATGWAATALVLGCPRSDKAASNRRSAD
jgi:hypothetical protein